MIKNFFKKKSNIVFILLLVVLFIRQYPSIKGSIDITGRNIPVMKLLNTKGEYVQFPYKEHKAVVYWATWCGPCHVQLKLMDSMTFDKASRDSVVAVSLGEDLKTVQKFLKKNPINFTVLLDPNNSLRRTLNILATPTIHILEDEKIRYATSGISPLIFLRY